MMWLFLPLANIRLLSFTADLYIHRTITVWRGHRLVVPQIGQVSRFQLPDNIRAQLSMVEPYILPIIMVFRGFHSLLHHPRVGNVFRCPLRVNTKAQLLAAERYTHQSIMVLLGEHKHLMVLYKIGEPLLCQPQDSTSSPSYIKVAYIFQLHHTAHFR